MQHKYNESQCIWICMAITHTPRAPSAFHLSRLLAHSISLSLSVYLSLSLSASLSVVANSKSPKSRCGFLPQQMATAALDQTGEQQLKNCCRWRAKVLSPSIPFYPLLSPSTPLLSPSTPLLLHKIPLANQKQQKKQSNSASC